MKYFVERYKKGNNLPESLQIAGGALAAVNGIRTPFELQQAANLFAMAQAEPTWKHVPFRVIDRDGKVIIQNFSEYETDGVQK